MFQTSSNTFETSLKTSGNIILERHDYLLTSDSILDSIDTLTHKLLEEKPRSQPNRTCLNKNRHVPNGLVLQVQPFVLKLYVIFL